MRRLLLMVAAVLLLAGAAEAKNKFSKYAKKYTIGGQEYTGYMDVPYGPGTRQKLDIQLPNTKEKAPLVIWIHGGSFKAGSKDQLTNGRFKDVNLPKGIAGAGINYTYRTPKSIKPCYDDVYRAVEFLFANASTLNIDTRKVAVAGGSAGSMLAWGVTFKFKSRISAVGSFMQPFTTASHILPGVKSSNPPVYIYQEVSGKVHPASAAIALKKKCDDKGVICELYSSGRMGIPRVLPVGINRRGGQMDGFIKFLQRVWSKPRWTLRDWEKANEKEPFVKYTIDPAAAKNTKVSKRR